MNVYFVLNVLRKSTKIYTAPLKSHLAQAMSLKMCLTGVLSGEICQ